MPFLVHALAADPDAAGRLGAPLPVRRSVAARLAQHRPAVATIAGAIAVLGDRCSVREAAELARLPLDEARRSTDALVRAGILAREDALRFAHPVVRAAIYADIEPADRAARHGAAATMLAAQAERSARHLLLAEPAGDGARAELLRRAAAVATDRGAPERARRYLERALAETADPVDRGRTLAELGHVELAAGRYARALEHLDVAVKPACDPTSATGAWPRRPGRSPA